MTLISKEDVQKILDRIIESKQKELANNPKSISTLVLEMVLKENISVKNSINSLPTHTIPETRKKYKLVKEMSTIR